PDAARAGGGYRAPRAPGSTEIPAIHRRADRPIGSESSVADVLRLAGERVEGDLQREANEDRAAQERRRELDARRESRVQSGADPREQCLPRQGRERSADRECETRAGILGDLRQADRERYEVRDGRRIEKRESDVEDVRARGRAVRTRRIQRAV